MARNPNSLSEFQCGLMSSLARAIRGEYILVITHVPTAAPTLMALVKDSENYVIARIATAHPAEYWDGEQFISSEYVHVPLWAFVESAWEQMRNVDEGEDES